MWFTPTFSSWLKSEVLSESKLIVAAFSSKLSLKSPRKDISVPSWKSLLCPGPCSFFFLITLPHWLKLAPLPASPDVAWSKHWKSTCWSMALSGPPFPGLLSVCSSRLYMKPCSSLLPCSNPTIIFQQTFSSMGCLFRSARLVGKSPSFSFWGGQDSEDSAYWIRCILLWGYIVNSSHLIIFSCFWYFTLSKARPHLLLTFYQQKLKKKTFAHISVAYTNICLQK